MFLEPEGSLPANRFLRNELQSEKTRRKRRKERKKTSDYVIFCRRDNYSGLVPNSQFNRSYRSYQAFFDRNLFSDQERRLHDL